MCRRLNQDQWNEYKPKLVVLDNGGGLARNQEWVNGLNHCEKIVPEVVVPSFNLGVAGSWNYFVNTFGKCLISNDDVIFGEQTFLHFNWSGLASPDAFIITNDDRVAGFSTFLVNRPGEWMAMGGFDELFNPAYFEDNDCRYRLSLKGAPVKSIRLKDWKHDNSSTLAAGDENYKRMHWCLYNRNKAYYIRKWGGAPGHEVFKKPFNT